MQGIFFLFPRRLSGFSMFFHSLTQFIPFSYCSLAVPFLSLLLLSNAFLSYSPFSFTRQKRTTPSMKPNTNIGGKRFLRYVAELLVTTHANRRNNKEILAAMFSKHTAENEARALLAFCATNSLDRK